MRYAPLNYNLINVAAGSYNPSTQKYDCYSMAYWERALFQRAMYSLEIDFDDVITGRNKDFIIYCLFKFGYVAFWNDDKYGLSFNPCTLKGYNMYYQPTGVLISNPAFDKTLDLEINKDCCIIKLTPDYIGIWDIIEHYAQKLSNMDPAIDTSLLVARVPYIWRAKSKAASESIKKFFDKIFKGEITVGLDDRIIPDLDNKNNENPFDFITTLFTKESYITDLQLRDQQTLINQFDREIGIPTIPYEKKERMVTSEADSTIIDSQSRITIWKQSLEESFKEIKQLYDLDFSVKTRLELMQGGDINVNNEDDIDRN